VDPEFVNSFEVGFNTSWRDGLISWNGATFLYNYEDQQVYQLQNSPDSFPINQLINAEDSRVFGVESDLMLSWKELRVFVALGYLFSEYSDFRNVVTFTTVTGTGQLLTTFEKQDFSGNRLVNAPELSITGFATYKLDLGRMGWLSPRFDFTYQSKIYFTPRNSDRVGDNSRWVFNLRLGYSDPEDRFEIAGWVRNLTDEIYRQTVFDQTRAQNSVVSVLSLGRTYGATLTMRF
jgi:iron complex outermembrane receptor protein